MTLSREEIYRGLEIEREYIQRHENTPRVMVATNLLLDMLVELQFAEAIDAAPIT